MKRSDPDFERWFWGKVDKSDGCWCWNGRRHRQGYGQLSVEKRTTFAHRVAYELGAGAIPAGLKVLHSCDNPPCCNPAHLSVGTQKDNVADAVRKGRMKTKHGSQHKLAKLTEEQVAEIRRCYLRGSSGEWSIVGISTRYGVSKSSVHRIIHHETWSHV